MGILGSLFGKKQAATPNPMRDTLFGDMPLDQWPRDATSTEKPWNAFVSARSELAAGNRAAAIAGWRQVLAQPGLEPRQYLQAWHFLRQHGQQPPADIAKRLLGVVVEVAMPGGLDLLAGYADHSARYYNYSGAGVVWDRPDTSLDTAIEELLSAGRQVVAQIGPCDEARPNPPLRDQARMSFLTPSGLHYGQGPMADLWNDPLGGPVIHSATALMQALIAKTNAT